jgi:hypothetical protein
VNFSIELLRAVLAGIGATAVMDVWAVLANWTFGIPMTDWAMVGRWGGHFRQGKFRHDSIAKATPVRGERGIGWLMHYATGIAYAALGLAVFGVEWTRAPTLGAAILLGVATIVAPFFIMQPGMGFGIAASRTPKPGAARLRSLMNHLAFGLGLYLAWSALALF